MKDRISNLPEDVILHILSFLTIKDVLATSILSTRWQHLWKLSKRLEFHYNYRFQRLKNFVGSVNHVMNQYQGSKLVQLTISSNYAINCTFIYRWISIALAKKVTTLILDLPLGEISFPLICDDQQSPMSCLEHVVLSGCYISASSLSILKSVRSLSLKNLSSISSDDFEGIFTTCLSLEELHLEDVGLCYFDNNVGGLRSPRIVGPSLKFLEIFSRLGYLALEINAPELRTFTYYGQNIKLCLEGTSKLVEVTLSLFRHNRFKSALSYLENELFQLENLTVAAIPNEVETALIPTLFSLKFLTLEVRYAKKGDFLAFASILKASPVLRKFHMHVKHVFRHEDPETHEAIEATEKWDKSTHTYLEEVYFSGFRGYKTEIRLLQYLLKTCPSLKQITLDPRERIRRSWHMALRKRKLQVTRDLAKQFGSQVPSNIKFVVL